MSILEIIRLEAGQQGTFGVLLIDKKIFCVTLELPARQNRANISCIPTGQYSAVRHTSPSFGPVLWILSVPGRTNILFHVGNTATDTKGCVLTGNSIGRIGKHRGILNSKATHKLLLGAVDDINHLTIREGY